MEVKQMHAKALEHGAQALPELLKKMKELLIERDALKAKVKELETKLALKTEFTPEREAILEKAAKAMLEKNPHFLEVTGQPG